MIDVYDNTEAAERGRELAGRARAWIVAHPGEASMVVAECRRIQREHRVVSRDLVYTSLRTRFLEVTDVPDYVKAHDLWSGIARYIARYCPDVEPSMARCTIDVAYPDLSDLPPLPDDVAARMMGGDDGDQRRG